MAETGSARRSSAQAYVRLVGAHGDDWASVGLLSPMRRSVHGLGTPARDNRRLAAGAGRRGSPSLCAIGVHGNLTLHTEGGSLSFFLGGKCELHHPGRRLGRAHSLGDSVRLPQPGQLERVRRTADSSVFSPRFPVCGGDGGRLRGARRGGASECWKSSLIDDLSPFAFSLTQMTIRPVRPSGPTPESGPA
jgi:hypothetical protein